MTKKRKKTDRKRSVRTLRNSAISSAVEPELLVFVSSAISGMEAERRAVRETIESIPLTRAWVFEYTPASADRVEDAYLQKVRECAIFVLLVAGDLSEPVRQECETARACNRRMLIFLRGDIKCPPEVQAYIDSLGPKWGTYLDIESLRQQVKHALTDELIKGYRSYLTLTAIPVMSNTLAERSDTEQMLNQLEQIARPRERGPRAEQEILLYLIMGIDPEMKLTSIVQLLTGRQPTPIPEDVVKMVEEIYFDDLDEFSDVFNTITILGRRAQKIHQKSPRSLAKLWSDEVIRRAKRMVSGETKVREGMRFDQVAGLSYLVLGFHKDWAPWIEMLRTPSLSPEPPKRDADEVRFESLQEAQEVAQTLQRLVREADGNRNRFLELLAEAAFDKAQQRFLEELPAE
jgi:hypothetical protein